MKPVVPVAVLAAVLAGAAVARGDEWPRPAEGWWEELEGGEEATYEVRVGRQTLRRVVTVEEVEGSTVTVSSRVVLDGNALAKRTETVDAAEPGTLAFPADARVEEVGEETLEVGGRSFPCTVYRVTLAGVTRRCWYSPALPPIFTGGNVKQETDGDGAPSAVILVGYEDGAG